MKRLKTGFTLTEFVMALTITSIIGLSAAGVSVAMSSANSQLQNYYESVAAARSMFNRVQDTLRKARLVTYASGGNVMVWAADTNGDGQINNDEVVQWSYNSGTQQIVEYRIVYPASVRSALNVTQPLYNYTSAGGLPSGSAAMTGSAYCTTTVLATGVTAFQAVLKGTAPTATLLKLSVTIGSGNQAVTLRSATDLRADSTANVKLSNNQYVLTVSTN
jgi:prepilin-type N-terminal cleavage/methylation domain-containing protein